MPKLCKIAMTFVLFICFLVLSSCRAGRDEVVNSPEISNEADDEKINEGSDIGEDYEKPGYSDIFTISFDRYRRLHPRRVYTRSDSSLWQVTSFLPEELNPIEGISVSVVKVRNFPHDFRTSLIIRNDTNDTLFLDFASINLVLEKDINGQWYEVPLYGGAQERLGTESGFIIPLYAGDEYWGEIILNLWRPYFEGRYRFIKEMSLHSDFETTFYVSREFELSLQDFRSDLSDEQVNAVEGVSLNIVDYSYELDRMRLSLVNNSGYTFDYGGLSWSLEKSINGAWHVIPHNSIHPDGHGGLGFFPILFNLMPRTENEEFAFLLFWRPISAGTYRFVLELEAHSVEWLPREDRELSWVSVEFKIVE